MAGVQAVLGGELSRLSGPSHQPHILSEESWFLFGLCEKCFEVFEWGCAIWSDLNVSKIFMENKGSGAEVESRRRTRRQSQWT